MQAGKSDETLVVFFRSSQWELTDTCNMKGKLRMTPKFWPEQLEEWDPHLW